MNNSIYSKIRRQRLILVTVATILFVSIIIADFILTRHTILTSNDKLGESAAESAREMLIEQKKVELQGIIGYKAALSDSYFNEITTNVRRMVYAAEDLLQHPRLSEHEALENLRAVLLLNILDSIKSSGGGAVYYATESGRLYYEDTFNLKLPTNTNMTGRPWYTSAKEAGTLVWSDLFDDAYGRGLSITCAMPFYTPDKKLIGVAATGMAITGIIDLVVETIGETGQAFMINEKGQIIIAENMQKDENGDPIRINLLESSDETVRNVAVRMMNGESDIERVYMLGVDRYIAFHSLKTQPWSLAVVIDVDEIVAPAQMIDESIKQMKQEAIDIVNRDRLIITLIVGLIVAIIYLLISSLSARMANNLTMPIRKMTADAEIIGAGDLNHIMKIDTGDELEILAKSFNTMVKNIKTMTIEKITAEAVATAIQESITYASKIQQDLLPPEKALKDAFADYSVIWEPRDIVSGDIYWMKSFVKGTVLCVADCTGHGVPGALLTMLVISALQVIATHYTCEDTAEIVYQLDKRLAAALNVKKGESTLPTTLNQPTNRYDMEINDGCDIAVLFIAPDGKIVMSTSGIDVFVCDGIGVKRLKGKSVSVGEGKIQKKDEISTFTIPYNPDNKYYIASDGLYDQMSPEKNKFGYRNLEKIILDNHNQPQSVIAKKIWEAFITHQATETRRDDVELISFKPETKRNNI